MKINHHLLIIFWVRPNSKNNNKNNPFLTTIHHNGFFGKVPPISSLGRVLIELCFLPVPYQDFVFCAVQIRLSAAILLMNCFITYFFLFCLINCQMETWLILRIAYTPNTSCDGIFCVSVCTIDRMTNIVDERISYQVFSLSKPICWNLKVSILLSMVWCNLSTIANVWVSFTDGDKFFTSIFLNYIR